MHEPKVVVAHESNPAEIICTFSCNRCKQDVKMVVKEADYVNRRGKLLKDAFPYLSAEEREIFISGNCPCCIRG